jgi:hypothetical protein
VASNAVATSSSQNTAAVTPTPPPTRVPSPTFNGSGNNVDDFPFSPQALDHGLSNPQSIHEICQMLTPPPFVTPDTSVGTSKSVEGNNRIESSDMPENAMGGFPVPVKENIVTPSSPVIQPIKGRAPKKAPPKKAPPKKAPPKAPPKKAPPKKAPPKKAPPKKAPPKKAPPKTPKKAPKQVAKAPAQPTAASRKRSLPSSSVEAPAPKQCVTFVFSCSQVLTCL